MVFFLGCEHAYFLERPQGEVRRTPLPRTRVHKAWESCRRTQRKRTAPPAPVDRKDGTLALGSGPPLPMAFRKLAPTMPDLRALGVSSLEERPPDMATPSRKRRANRTAFRGTRRHKIEKDPAEAGRKKANIGC